MDLHVHFLNVGCGNMVLMHLPGGAAVLYDCNIPHEREALIFAYLDGILGRKRPIDVLINSHPHPDHIRGIRKLHRRHPIGEIWGTEARGADLASPEYDEFLKVRSRVKRYALLENTRLRMSGVEFAFLDYSPEHSGDADEESIVLRVSYGDASLILTGDTTARRWKEKIVPKYGEALRSNALLASHHGSLQFFEDPPGSGEYYEDHLAAISPEVTVVSVGPNEKGLPDNEALALYAKYCRSCPAESGVWITGDKGSMRLSLSDTEGWETEVFW